MSGAIAWRDDASDLPAEGAVVAVCRLEKSVALEPNARDLAEAPTLAVARRTFLARRASTRRMVAARLGVSPRDVVVGHAPSGAPMILAPPAALHVSVSGRGDFCAIGLAPSPIGVDIEPLGAAAEPAWNILHQTERRGLRALDRAARHEAFLRLWTAKEAYLKALGQGMSREPSRVEIVFGAADVFLVREQGVPAPLRAAQWRRWSLCGEAFVVACVVR